MRLVLYPDKILRKKSKIASDDEAEKIYPGLITGLITYSGLGLAAPQVGIDRQIAVISAEADESLDKPLILLNPRILEKSGSQSIEEGCLSVTGVRAEVPRYGKIIVESGPVKKRRIIEADGLLSIVIQHEMDHLNGILFPDHLGGFSRLKCLVKARKEKKILGKKK
ncbi:MAG: peptide deformylase [Elusimicrobia bacterium]|nr:peptide deformylase [Elusimicrobiota bacterium]